jgi:uncharacterized protein YhaN
MRIETIHIDGFGIWSDRTWAPLQPGLTVFHGPNETGKSTLMAFIRSVLFGFDRRGSVRRYEPLNGGSHGGTLNLVIGERRLRIERKVGRHVRGAVAVYEGDATAGDEELNRLLGGTTRTLYHNVFAFGLEELEQFHTLQETEVATHISGAGLGVGAARWAAVQRDLEDRQTSLFLPRGQNGTINLAFKELEAVRDDLDRTEHQPDEYWTAHEARSALSSEVSTLENQVSELRKLVEHYETRRKERPLIEQRARLHARLKELPVVEVFPEGGIERLNLLRRQCNSLENALYKKRREMEQLRLRRFELNSVADPREIAVRTRELETLRSLLSRIDAVTRVYSASVHQRDAIMQERRTLEAASESSGLPSKFAFVVFVVLLWFCAGGLLLAGYPYLAAGVSAVSLTPLLWYRRRKKASEGLGRKISECAERLRSCQLELKKTEQEARHVETEIRILTGRTDITPSDIDIRASELDRLSKHGDEIRKVTDGLVQAEAEARLIDGQIEDARQSISALLTEGAARNENDFLERAEIFKQRSQILLEIEKIPVAPESGLLFDMSAEEDVAYDTAARDLQEAVQRLITVRHEAGRVDERITMMERSEERARAIAKQETILARIDTAAEQWAVLALCRTMLDETRRIYETERQPEVLRQASSFFSIMTDGRYARVFTPVDGAEIQVERDDGVRLSPHMLSRGTAEQLYLAMRLALVREYANHVDPLPVIFDDIFVNFDPARTVASIRAVRELCATHQVLLFTCHPHLVGTIQEIVPDARLFPLQ